MMATPQTIATCHSPASDPVSTALWTAPQPKNTRMKVPSTSAPARTATARAPVAIRHLPRPSARPSFVDTLLIVRLTGQRRGTRRPAAHLVDRGDHLGEVRGIAQ